MDPQRLIIRLLVLNTIMVATATAMVSTGARRTTRRARR